MLCLDGKSFIGAGRTISGDADCVLDRRPFIKRDVLLAADAIYKGNCFVPAIQYAANFHRVSQNCTA